MLPERRSHILKTIVAEYIATANPVASETINRRYPLAVSPATIRNEMARLEEEGYITRPHTSAGGVPSDKGYRFYVESLIREARLSEAEERNLRHLFRRVEQNFEEWMRLTAAILAQRVRNAALISFPRAVESRFKHLDLVALQDYLALLILVLEEANLKRQLLSLKQVVSQSELTFVANKLNAHYTCLTRAEIQEQELALSAIEEQVTEAALQLMQDEDEQQHDEFYFTGLRHLLSQPEFAGKEKVVKILEMLEEGSKIRTILTSLRSSGQDIMVSIGAENDEEALQECSLIIIQYGIPRKATGAIGVMGPKRMDYRFTIPSVKLFSSLMSELLAGYIPESKEMSW